MWAAGKGGMGRQRDNQSLKKEGAWNIREPKEWEWLLLCGGTRDASCDQDRVVTLSSLDILYSSDPSSGRQRTTG